MSTLYAPAERIWTRVLKRVSVDESGCWLWQGTVTRDGYGLTGSGRSAIPVLVHRVAVMARDGSIPDGMQVDHVCHNTSTCPGGRGCPHRRCCNPAHLEVVTQKENIYRAYRKRAARNPA